MILVHYLGRYSELSLVSTNPHGDDRGSLRTNAARESGLHFVGSDGTTGVWSSTSTTQACSELFLVRTSTAELLGFPLSLDTRGDDHGTFPDERGADLTSSTWAELSGFSFRLDPRGACSEIFFFLPNECRGAMRDTTSPRAVQSGRERTVRSRRSPGSQQPTRP